MLQGRDRTDGAARAAGHRPNKSAHLPRRDAHGRQDLQPVRALNREHSQGQGRQAQRVWQARQTVRQAENQIIIDFEVYDRRPSDTDVLIPAIETHEAVLGRTPRLVGADAGFYSAKNEAAAKAKGVKRVSIPNRSTKSLERKRVQKKRWFRNGQKWRTGCEGRISVVKRRHGLSRCRYRGEKGMKRWVGLGVIADNLISMGNALARQANTSGP